MAEEKKTNKERLREITEGIERGIQELFETDKYRQYLSTMSRFHRYSVNNTMLIYMQRPDATLVAGFNKWHNQFGRHVKKGERGITIIAPTPFKKKIEEQKLDPDTKAPMLDADGKVITEEKEIEIPMFKPVKVFDVSQTDGKPLPQLANSLSGDVKQYEAFMEALRRSSPVPIAFEKMDSGTDGYFRSDEQRISIREGMSQVQTVSAAVHEIAHAKLHNYEKMTVLADDGETVLAPEQKDRNTEEVEAESISYGVCQYYGIQTGENSFGYIATWSQGKELKELRESLETINKTSSELITSIDRHFQEICKERGIDLTEQVETAAPEQSIPASPKTASVPLPDAPEITLDEYPMPDEHLKVADLEACGYMDGDMLPVSREGAMELYDQDLTVYTIVSGGSAEMMFDREEFDTQATGTVFAVSREEWEDSHLFHDKIMDRQNRQPEREQAFLSHSGDCFAIYQITREPENTPIRFMNLDWMESHNLPIDRDNYSLIYTGELPTGGSANQQLESVYVRFNIDRPADYHSPSLSVSDIVAIKQNGVVSCHYCDSIGFREVPSFLDNPLKNAEMQLEDDYGMIDGINPEESVIPKKSGKRRRRDEFCW